METEKGRLQPFFGWLDSRVALKLPPGEFSKYHLKSPDHSTSTTSSLPTMCAVKLAVV